MGDSPAPQLAPITPDPYAVAQAQQAANADLQETENDLGTQSNRLQRTYGNAGMGASNGISSTALAPLGAAAGVR